MTIVFAYGAITGALCAAWDWVMVFTGSYTALQMHVAGVVTLTLLIVGLVAGLWRTAKLGQRYLEQVLSGFLITIIACLIIALNSVLLTGVLVPGYSVHQQELHVQALRKAGKSEDEIVTALAGHQFSAIGNAAENFAGGVIVGGVATILFSIFLRARSSRERSGVDMANING